MFEAFADWLIYAVAGIPETTHWGKSIHFFVYETLKIGFLLLLVTHLMGLVNAYFPVERVRALIASDGFAARSIWWRPASAR